MTGSLGKLEMLAIGFIAFAFVVGLILLLADRAPKTGREKWQLAVFLGPGMLLLVFGLIYPAIRTMYLSFFDSNGEKLVNFDNYSWIFTQPDIRLVLRNTAVWVIFAPVIVVAAGLLYAVLVDNKPGERIAKSLIFIPMAISGVAASIIWKFVYANRAPDQTQIGLLNQVAIWLGFTPPDGGWLQSPPLNTFLLIVIFIWAQVGFTMVLLSAAIKAIPADMVEAARLDGTNAWQMFWRITVPTVRPALITTYMVVLLGTLKTFDIVYTTTGGNFDTSVVAYQMYFESFVGLDSGHGGALAVLLFILVLPAVWFQVRQLRHQRENA
jgi:alpha-glucoside transport system permease protein